MSLALFAVLAILGVAIGSAIAGRLSFQYLFSVNFVAAMILMFGGVLVELLPIRLPKKSKLVDHSTHVEYVVNQRQIKREKAHEIIYLGLLHLLLTSVIQLILSVIL